MLLKQKIFERGCNLIAFYINSSIEEERRETVNGEIFGLLTNIKMAKDKNRVRTSISEFRVTPLQQETHKLISKLGYTLVWNKEDSADCYFELIKGGNGEDLL